MNRLILLSAAIVLASCNNNAPATNDAMANNVMANDMTADTNVADANAAAPMALASLSETTWEYTDPDTGKAITESVDANGKYISQAGTEHVDHGTATMKDGKACFTSAMNKDGETCWTDPMVDVGQSGETTSDKGQKLVVKRVAYVPMTM